MTDPLLELLVDGVEDVASNIRSFVLRAPDGRSLPGFSPGAHIDIPVPECGVRSYSLIVFATDSSETNSPAYYRIAVQLERPGRGGSTWMHALRVGDPVSVSMPKNHFELQLGRDGTVLLAGGIGVTPLIAMAARLTADGAPYRLIYAARDRSSMAFLPQLEHLCGERLELHCDDQAGVRFGIEALILSLPAGVALHVCGPRAMIDAAIGHARTAGWEEGRLRFELFSSASPDAADMAFEVHLLRSDKRVQVSADQSILDALLAAGEAPMFDCQRGDCGLCQVPVISGVPDHRDYYLSDRERAMNTVMQICVSRSRSPLLVLDL